MSEEGASIPEERTSIPMAEEESEAPQLSEIKGLKALILFEEEERTILEDDSSLRSYTGTGKITIKNPATEEGMWSIRLKLANFVNTNLQEESYTADDLGPGSEWNMNYQLTTMGPAVELVEKIDTDFDLEKDPNFDRDDLVYGAETSILFQLSVTNHLEEPMSEIVVRKKVPLAKDKMHSLLTEGPEFLDPYPGEVHYDKENREVVWTLTDVEPKKTQTLRIVGKIAADRSEPIEAGEVTVTYQQVDRRIVSDLKPELFALTTVMPLVEAVEGDTANTWDCKATFEGNPEFQVMLERFTVIHKETGSVLYDSGEMKHVLSKDESWASTFVAQDEKMPKLKHKVVYRVPWDVTRGLKGTITKISQKLPVVKVSVVKEFDPPSVPTYARTPVNVAITVTNEGSAPVHHLRFNDHLPAYALLEENSFTFSTESESITHQLEEDASTEQRRSLLVEVDSSRLSAPLIQPGSSATLSYKIVAEKPVPGGDYLTPLLVEAFALPAARSPNTAQALVEGRKDPELKIAYTKRAIRTGKAIIPRGPGKFRVRIRVQNLGGVPLERVEVRHVVPSNYKFEENLSKAYNYEEEASDDGVLFKWTIPSIQPSDSITIEYEVTGEGEFDPDEPEIHVPEVA